MVDTYTKVILTVIAVSFSTIAFKDFFVTPVNAGIDGVTWKDYYYDGSFEIAVKETIENYCRAKGQNYGYADEAGNVVMEVSVDLRCRW